MSKLYVGNLPWDVEDDVLFNEFAPYGATSARVQKGRDGRSRGFGIVETTNPDEAIRSKDGATIGGRSIVVRLDGKGRAAPAAASSAPAAVSMAAAAAAVAPAVADDGSIALFVGNLSWSTSNESLAAAMRGYGVEYVNIPSRSGRSAGYAIVHAPASRADEIISAFNGLEFEGRHIEVRYDRGRTTGTTSAAPRARASAPAVPAAYASASAAVPATSSGLGVYLGNLPWSVTDDNLRTYLPRGVSPSSLRVMIGRDGRSRGYAVLTFASVMEAENAIAALNGATIDGRSAVARLDRSS